MPHLYQIGVPSIATDMQVIVARFLPRWLPKDMSCGILQSARSCAFDDEAYDISTRAQNDLPFGLNDW